MNWQHPRTMTAQEYRKAIHQLGLNKAQAGRLLGRSEKTAHRYWDGKAIVPAAEVLLLRALLHYGEPPMVPPYEGIRAKRAKERQLAFDLQDKVDTTP